MYTGGLITLNWTTFCCCLVFVSVFSICIGTHAKQVTSPNEDLCINSFCGYPNDLPVHVAVMENGSEYEIYHLNRTAELLESQEFAVTIDQTFGDAVRSLNYTDSAGNVERLEIAVFYGVSPVGGRPALRQRMYFMALLGQRRKEGGADWICDGILINDQWVLSAAHCFYSTFYINVVRLGEYDWKQQPKEVHDNYPFDHTIQDIIVHPLYKSTVGYHDLILIKLQKKIGTMHANIAPICLPWGSETNRNHVGSTLTMSGWGATSYGAPKTNILTEVDLEIFNSTRCDQSYSTLQDYPIKFPEKITKDTILCAGSNEGGKDACKGDSGAPLVYVRDDGKMVLAGVVSAGFGCGLKEFPGLYIPINNPLYLQWIKDVAFSKCSQSGF